MTYIWVQGFLVGSILALLRLVIGFLLFMLFFNLGFLLSCLLFSFHAPFQLTNNREERMHFKTLGTTCTWMLWKSLASAIFSDKRLVVFHMKWKRHQPFVTSPSTSLCKQRQGLRAGHRCPEQVLPAHSDHSQHDASVLFDESRKNKGQIYCTLTKCTVVVTLPWC